MISVKGGTQTYSNAVQESSLKADPNKTITNDQLKQTFGEENIGDVLNKVADPNWVDPSKLRKVGNNQLDKEAFLKLLLAQLKHQDPTNPMESHEMAAQLAQFSSLEQLSGINKGIEQISQKDNKVQDFDSLNLIGKAVSGDSAKILRNDGDTSHEMRFELAKDSRQVDVAILDAAGQVVRELKLNNLKAGKNKISWNGRDVDGKDLPAGEYKMALKAVGADGTKVGSRTQFEGVISGVNFTAEGPVLLIGKQSIRMSDVKKIIDPAQLQKQNPAKEALQKQNQKGAAIKPESKPESSQKVAGGNMDSVGLSRGLMNNLKKQGIKAGM